MVKIHDIRNQTKRSNGTRKLSSITHIARHHSATTSGDFFSFWKHWNGTNGWGTGGYHEIILRDGSVQLCYDPEEITNGVGNHNGYVYHICVVGNSSFTAAQEAAFKERCLYNMKRLNIPVERVWGHREFKGASTTCPGIDMNMVRNSLKGGVEQVSKPTTPLPANVLGTVEVLVDSLNVRTAADFNAKVAKTIKRGETYRAYELKNGLYNLGGNQWVSGGNSYVRFVKNPAYKDPAAQAKKEAEKLANEKAKQKDEQDLKRAIALGITNGERLNEPATRRQVALMIIRALDQK